MRTRFGQRPKTDHGLTVVETLRILRGIDQDRAPGLYDYWQIQNYWARKREA